MSVMKTLFFSLQLSLSPFTFSITEVRHCFASSFLSCGCFFLTLSLSPFSSSIKRKELMLLCCCTPYPKLKMSGCFNFSFGCVVFSFLFGSMHLIIFLTTPEVLL